MNALRRIKRWILKSGIAPSRRLDFLNALLAYGQWLRRHPAGVHLETREKLYEHIASKMNGKPFDYLEAGVYRGESMKYWAQLSRNPLARFYGFDTFTGLPEAWHTGANTFKEGFLDVGGRFPGIDDSRVRFIKGRFQETLPGFLREHQPQDNLIVHCDADLYTSTLYFLTAAHPILRPGTHLLFDNFSVATHDFRAFTDYVTSYCREYDVIATAEFDFEKVAVRLR